jgi:ketosteroid isomerase-like protein
VATILRFHDAMEAADREALDAMLEEIAHPDCEWMPLVATVEGGYRGKEETREFFSDFLDSFDVRYQDREVHEVGETGVLVLSNMSLRGRGSGVDVVQEMGVLYEFEGGLLRRGRAYPSHAEAEAAAQDLREASRA